jgi:hypothetical protein
LKKARNGYVHNKSRTSHVAFWTQELADKLVEVVRTMRRDPMAETSEARLSRRLKASEDDVLRKEASLEKATAYRGCETPREQALLEGLLKPSNCATRANGRNERSEIEGETLPALPVEGATRAPLVESWRDR